MLNSTVGEATRALAAYDALEQSLRIRVKEDPDAAIALTAQELGVLFEGQYFRTVDEPRHANFFGDMFEPSVNGQFFGADTFLRDEEFSRTLFLVNGETVEAGHLNYIAVGMLAAHYGPYMHKSIPDLVFAHNFAQVLGLRGGGGPRNFKDILPGTKWALIGAGFYKRKSRQSR